MKKKYIVEFKEQDGTVYQFEFITADIKKSVIEYSRNRSIVKHKIIKESSRDRKQMLFG